MTDCVRCTETCSLCVFVWDCEVQVCVNRKPFHFIKPQISSKEMNSWF